MAYIKGRIKPRPERKYHDIGQTTYHGEVPSAGTGVTLMNGIAEGDDNTMRRGRQVYVDRFQLSGYMVPGAVIVPPSKPRFMLVWDNAPHGALPNVTDVLTAYSSIALLNTDNEERFTVLWDWSTAAGGFSDNVDTSFAGQDHVHNFEEVIDVGAITQYSGSGSTIASISNGALLLLNLGDVITASSCVLYVTTRTTFYDL